MKEKRINYKNQSIITNDSLLINYIREKNQMMKQIKMSNRIVKLNISKNNNESKTTKNREQKLNHFSKLVNKI